MTTEKKPEGKLSDLTAKLNNAEEAATAPEAGEREKADLKLLEAEVLAEKLKSDRPAKPPKKPASGVDAKLDKALADSFPGSDPVSFLEAAPVKKGDLPLSTVDATKPSKR